jgi:hypothetical protein
MREHCGNPGPNSTCSVGSVAICFSGMFHGLQGFYGRRRRWIETSRQVRPALFDLRLEIASATRIVSTISKDLPRWHTYDRILGLRA